MLVGVFTIRWWAAVGIFRQTMSKKKALEKMEILPDPSNDVDPDSIRLKFPEPVMPKKSTLITASDVRFQWPGSEGQGMLLDGISCQIESTSRIGMLGANGAGKSTLIKLLLGDMEPVRQL